MNDNKYLTKSMTKIHLLSKKESLKFIGIGEFGNAV